MPSMPAAGVMSAVRACSLGTCCSRVSRRARAKVSGRSGFRCACTDSQPIRLLISALSGGSTSSVANWISCCASANSMLASSCFSSSSWMSSKRTSASGIAGVAAAAIDGQAQLHAESGAHRLGLAAQFLHDLRRERALIDLGRLLPPTWLSDQIQTLDHVVDQRTGLLQHRFDAVMQGGALAGQIIRHTQAPHTKLFHGGIEAQISAGTDPALVTFSPQPHV